jgi:hypothetical protein
MCLLPRHPTPRHAKPVLIDAGSNVGSVAVPALKSGFRVIGIEAMDM